jgi:acetyl-CoA carboxylase carboxyl transferase beta subunit/acetyl-CoA carboxylase carboxyl transferase alpha subunit
MKVPTPRGLTVARGLTEVLSVLFGRRGNLGGQGTLAQENCLMCDAPLLESELYKQARVCPECRFHYSISARERIQLLADPKSFKEKFRTINSLDPLAFSGKITYRTRIFDAQKSTGLTEAVVVGQCKIEGISTVLVALDFSFLGGSMGLVVGEKIALACELAGQKHLPLVAIVTSGGSRLQEGALSLMQMAKTATAVNALHRKGLPYIAVFANPTTGQSYASFANLADVLLAEPGALMGFAPLRVIQEMADHPLPIESHTAESHLKHGMLDAVVDREELRGTLSSLMRRLVPAKTKVRLLRPREREQKPKGAIDAWEAVQRSRHPERPTARDYISRVFGGFVEIHGDRLMTDDPNIICGVGDLYGSSVMVVAQQRTPRPAGEPQGPYIGPDGFRKAQRAMHMAVKFGIPLITLIDSAGPAQTLEAEEGGLGHAIATTMATMANLPIPTVAVILSEGGRESGLALSIADRILMLEGAIYAPMSPEAAASMLYRDDSRAEDAAHSLRLTATDGLDMKIIDKIVPEPVGGAHTDPEASAYTLERALVRAVAKVQGVPVGRLLSRRHKRFRNKGEYTTYYHQFLSREVEELEGYEVKEEKDEKGGLAAKAKNDTKVILFPGVTADLEGEDAEDLAPDPAPQDTP